MLYAQVILPLLLPPMTYSFDSEVVGDVVVGSSVMVELGNRKLYEGVVCEITDIRPDYKNIKSILKLTSSKSLVSVKQIELWKWIASYYMCTLGEVMRVAMPKSLKNSAFNEQDFDNSQFKVSKIKLVRVISQIEKPLRGAKQALVYDEISNNPLSPARMYDSAVLKALVNKQLIEIKEVEKSLGEFDDFELPVLSEAQTLAFNSIEEQFKQKNVVLLRGVTGSGKTEIYINLIAEKLAKSEDVLYLVPEIALTAQLITRLERVFGDRVNAYHSKFSNNQRADLYSKISRAKGQLIVGVRSSVFLPFNNLSLVIIDEEHDASFKQMEPAPNYHARDVAVVLGSIYSCKVLMGSATPSLESYTNAKAGKYGYTKLMQRYADAQLPEIIVSDNIRAIKRGERKGHFNKLLIDKITQSLENKQQVILFQNRRGFSPYIECQECGYVPGCPNCNVSLTLHKSEGRLKCHYCGYQTQVVNVCPKCNSQEIKSMGFGTEKIEQDLSLLFPEARVARLDADTASSRKAFEKIITDFENHNTDIIIGTQMITKGFDFENVTLVGVLNADNILNQPDFRASERAFQLITQVSGRAGRGEYKGEVVIQTSQKESPVLDCVIRSDYKQMIALESSIRQAFSYPPYCRLIQIELKSKNKQTLRGATMFMNDAMRKVFANRVLGPQTPAVDKVKEYYLIGFLLKIERKASFVRAKTLLEDIISELNSREEFKYVDVNCNVDPY